MSISLLIKYSLLLYDSNKTCVIDRFSKNPQIPNSVKIRTLGAEFSHT
jgi:hypothetical protein